MRGMAQANTHATTSALPPKGPGMGMGLSYGPYHRDEATPSPGPALAASKDADAPALIMDGMERLSTPAFSAQDVDLNSEATCELDTSGAMNRQGTPRSVIEAKPSWGGEDPCGAPRAPSKEEKASGRWWKPSFGLRSRSGSCPPPAQKEEETTVQECVIQDMGSEGMSADVQPLNLSRPPSMPRHSPEVESRGRMGSIMEVAADLVSDCGDVDDAAHKPRSRSVPPMASPSHRRQFGAAASPVQASPVCDFGGLPGLALDD